MGDTLVAQRPIVDAHHHLWSRARHPQTWIDPVVMAAIDADFGHHDLAAEASHEGVMETVVVQSIASESETAELLALASGSWLVGGVVGWVDLTAADIAERLDRLRDAPGGDRLVGIRHLVQDEADPSFLDRADVRRGIAAVGAAGMVFDLLVRDHQLPGAIRLARELPEVVFVLDHLGKPAIRGGDLDDWARDLAELARLPNTTAKLSGLVTEADWSAWTPSTLRPAVSTALETFGPRRLMFGSDWPVCLLASSYRGWVSTLTELLEECDETTRALIWHSTARRVYGLERG
ncbi:amidohydrolase family protein [Jiangella endophytica]|uniref:amidohydrolase family protein n=1 Tax=Jiangella endophytica TaxID=1623398 RepID=UPI000E3464D4|nr:amidohydrolase family protein [Jiangella endophytica]